jgi:hypothetical protein
MVMLDRLSSWREDGRSDRVRRSVGRGEIRFWWWTMNI